MNIEEELCQYCQERKRYTQTTHCLTGEWWQEHLKAFHLDVENCVINFFVLKLSLAITLLCAMWTVFCYTV